MSVARFMALGIAGLAVAAVVGLGMPDRASASDVGLHLGFGFYGGHHGHHKHWRHHRHGHHKHWRHHGRHHHRRGYHHYRHHSDYQVYDEPSAGATSDWIDPDDRYAGEVTTRTYREPSGRYCREFTRTIVIDGQQEEAYGRACRQPDGSWEIVN